MSLVELNSMASRRRRSDFLGEVWRLAEKHDLSVEEVLAALSTEADRLVQRLLRNAFDQEQVATCRPAHGGMFASLPVGSCSDTHVGETS